MKMVAAATIAAFALMGTALSASAATINLGTLVDGDAPNIGTGKASTGKFTDTYNFTLDGGSTSFSVQPSVVLSVVAKKGFAIAATVSNFTISLLQGSSLVDTFSVPLATVGTKLSLFDDNLLANTAYSLVVSGSVNAAAGNTVSYGGSMPVVGVSTVPLPTSVALFGTAVLGLGLAGAARRKASKASAAV